MTSRIHFISLEEADLLEEPWKPLPEYKEKVEFENSGATEGER